LLGFGSSAIEQTASVAGETVIFHDVTAFCKLSLGFFVSLSCQSYKEYYFHDLVYNSHLVQEICNLPILTL